MCRAIRPSSPPTQPPYKAFRALPRVAARCRERHGSQSVIGMLPADLDDSKFDKVVNRASGGGLREFQQLDHAANRLRTVIEECGRQ